MRRMHTSRSELSPILGPWATRLAALAVALLAPAALDAQRGVGARSLAPAAGPALGSGEELAASTPPQLLFPGSVHFLPISPDGIVPADVDGDGDRDLVAACDPTGGSVLALLRNRGDATFEPVQTTACPGIPDWLAGGDLDGDGAVDLVTVHGGSPSRVRVFRNLGQGTFAPPVAHDVGAASTLVDAVDLDGDGDLDLVVGSRLGAPDGELTVLFNAGDATFAPPVDHVVGAHVAFAPGDLDGDGDLDLAVLRVTGAVAVWQNDGHGGLTPSGSFPGGGGGNLAGRASRRLTSARAIATVDVDGDHDLDLAVVGGEDSPAPSVVSVLRNDGHGAFGPPRFVASLETVSWASAADLDADGASDLLLGAESGVWVLASKAGEGFAPPVLHETGSPTGSLVACDLDEDGFPDVAALSRVERVTILRSGRGLRSQLAFPADSPAGVLPVDLDGDGELELVYGKRDGGTLSVLERESDGSFAPPVTYATGQGPTYVAAGDIDGDGDQDLGVSHVMGINGASILRNFGDGSFAAPVEYAAPGMPATLALADLDGDGAPDLVIQTATTSTAGVGVLLNDGLGAFGPRVQVPTGFGTAFLALGDLDRDGDLDCAVSVQDGTLGPGVFAVLRNQGDGTLEPAVRHGAGGSSSLALGDLDGDGDVDVATTSFNGASSAYHNLGDAAFASALPLDLIRGGRVLRAADLDGDGDLELVVARDVGFPYVAVLPNGGDGTFTGQTAYFAAGTEPSTLGIGDLDGDRDLDLVTGSRPLSLPGRISVLWNRTPHPPRFVGGVQAPLRIEPAR